MKSFNLTKWLSAIPFSALSLLSTTSSFAQGTTEVCKSSPIPDGFVYIRQATKPDCGAGLDNAWVIKRPGPIEQICKGQSIPKGYVITRDVTIIGCPGTLNNGVEIKIP
jgi:hypothetical protein